MRTQFLITGAAGQLGSVLLARLVAARPDAAVVGVVSPGGPRPDVGRTLPCDLTHADELVKLVRSLQPQTIIHTAAMTAVGECFRRAEAAVRVNVDATRRLVELAAEQGARVVFTSTDLVFDGHSGGYVESSPAGPLSIYGRTKLEAEQAVRAARRGLVVRLPLMYGLPRARRATTFMQQLEALRDGQPLRLFHDEFRSPLALDDAADALLLAAGSDATGLLHVAGPQRLSRLDMGRMTAAALGVSDACIVPIGQCDLAFDEPRPADVSLRSERFATLFGRPPGREMSQALPEIVAGFRSRR